MGNEAKLALEDGTVLKGEAFGYETVTVGDSQPVCLVIPKRLLTRLSKDKY